MTVYDLANEVISALESEDIPHMLVGAMSSSVYGIPRATKDVDFVISIRSHAPLLCLEERLKETIRFDPQVTFETITGSRRHLLHSRSRPPITVELFEVSDDPFVRERFSRRKQEYSAQLDRAVWLPTAEDVVIQKLRWARDKDLVDVRDVLAVQSPENLDMNYIRRWCELHGSLERLDKLVASLPPGL